MEHFGQLAECSNLPTCGMAKFIQNWITITCFVNTTKEKSILFYHQNIQNKMEHQLADVSFMYILALSRRMLLLRASISFQLGIASINPVYRFPFPMILSTCFNHINTEFKKNICSISSTYMVYGFCCRLSWAITCHKMQGQTVKKGSKLIIHGNSGLQNGMAYVM